MRTTPDYDKAIEEAENQARKLGHDYIGGEHLLLALIANRFGCAAGLLANLTEREISIVEARKVLTTLLDL